MADFISELIFRFDKIRHFFFTNFFIQFFFIHLYIFFFTHLYIFIF